MPAAGDHVVAGRADEDVLARAALAGTAACLSRTMPAGVDRVVPARPSISSFSPGSVPARSRPRAPGPRSLEQRVRRDLDDVRAERALGRHGVRLQVLRADVDQTPCVGRSLAEVAHANLVGTRTRRDARGSRLTPTASHRRAAGDPHTSTRGPAAASS